MMDAMELITGWLRRSGSADWRRRQQRRSIELRLHAMRRARRARPTLD